MAIVLTCARFAHGELLVGDFRGSDTAGPVLRYADSADGAAAPASAFYTDLNAGADVLHSAASMTFESVENVTYVADYQGAAVRVYSVGATGNAAPLRTLDPPQLGKPRQVTVSLKHDELIVANDCCVAAFVRDASGNTAYALRNLPSGNTAEGSRTRLNVPAGIVLRASGEEIAVPDTGVGPGNSTFGVVLYFSRAVTGNSAPYRTLEGAATLLGAAAVGIGYDDSHDEIIVLSRDSAQAPYGFRISTFAASVSGDVPPLHSLSGASTLLDDAHSIFYDDAAETLHVSVGGDDGIPPRVLAFARGADGEAAPQRIIAANGASFVAPRGITVTFDRIFRDGFN